MVTDKPLRPRSCAGPIRAGVRRHMYEVQDLNGPGPKSRQGHGHALVGQRECHV